MKKLRFWPLLVLGIFFVYVFRSFWSGSDLSMGDAPFYFSENLQELFSIPYLWNTHNFNFGASSGIFLWLYFPTFLFGLINKILPVSSDLLIRLVFYIPATVSALIGSYLYSSLYTKNHPDRTLAAFLFTFNTYFLLVLDGGQVGFALAYGLFPLTLFFYERQKQLLSLFLLFLISNIDLRILFIALLYIFTKEFCEFITGEKQEVLNRLKNLIKNILLIICLDAFWVLPFINQVLTASTASVSLSSGNSLIKLFHPLLLYSPHFPLNQFGVVFSPPFYYVLAPLILFLPLFFKLEKAIKKQFISFASIYLFFVFLTKGDSPPLGQIYSFFVQKVPLANAYRDSSKFFLPLLLSASVLITISFEVVSQRLKKFNKLIWIAYLLILCIFIAPVFNQKLTGSLGSSSTDNSYSKLHDLINSKADFSRTLYFPLIPERGFRSWSHPAINGNELYKEHPIASLIEGEYDLFNYLHNPHFEHWSKLLGIDRIVISNEYLNKGSEEEKYEHQLFLRFVSSIPYLRRESQGLNSFHIDNSVPHIFGHTRALLSFGGDEIFPSLFKFNNFKLENTPLIFAESGDVDLNRFFSVDKDSLAILNSPNLTEEVATVFLKDKIESTQKLSSKWAFKSSSEYLSSKYFLQKNKLSTFDYDFGKGISYSSIPGETMTIKNLKQGNLFFGIRSASATDSSKIRISIDNSMQDIKNNALSWQILGPFKKIDDIKIENVDGTNMVSGFFIVSEPEMLDARQKSGQLLNRFSVLDLEADQVQLESFLSSPMIPISSKEMDPTRYNIEIPEGVRWVTFTDHFDQAWQLNGSSAMPFYGMLNGFYAHNLATGQIAYKGQEVVEVGILISLTTLLLSVVFLVVRRYGKFN